MTREEAIKMLSLYEVNDVGEGELETWYNGIDKDMREALDMAIEALSVNEGLRCALAGGRKCFAQGYDFTWCITCPHISEEDRQLVNHAVMLIPSEQIAEDGTLEKG